MKQFWEDLQKSGYKIHNKRVLSELELPLKISKETLETDKCMEYALILRWLEEKHYILINTSYDFIAYDVYIKPKEDKEIILCSTFGGPYLFTDKNEALKEAIKQAIKTIKL